MLFNKKIIRSPKGGIFKNTKLSAIIIIAETMINNPADDIFIYLC